MDHSSDASSLNLRDIRRRFGRAAGTFDDVDFVHAATREGLFERLQPVAVDAKTILDLGAGTGSAIRRLRQRFRGAHVIALDLSHRMLKAARRKRRWLERQSFVQCHAGALPFADNSIDIVFSNMMLPWVDDLAAVFGEVTRVMRRGGLFAFSTLGPDSLLQLRRAWQTDDSDCHVNRFPDMHDVGDELVRAGLVDPVLDVDRLSISYDSPEALFRDMTAAGARNCLAHRRRSLCGKRRFARMTESLLTDSRNGKITIELELVYGHCWGSGQRPRGGEFHVAAEQIPLRRRDDV